MGPNIPKDDSNFFHRMCEKFTIDFIVLVNQFKPRKEILFIKEGSRKILFNTVLDSLFKNMIKKITSGQRLKI